MRDKRHETIGYERRQAGNQDDGPKTKAEFGSGQQHEKRKGHDEHDEQLDEHVIYLHGVRGKEEHQGHRPSQQPAALNESIPP